MISTSINRYMYISIHPYFDPEFTSLKYSSNELVDNPANIKHAIFNKVLNQYRVSGVEITSTADVPQGTGLGSSSSFTVGLLHTVACYQGKYIAKTKLAEMACDIEINQLLSPIGKQDQYAAALGGLNYLRFNPDGTVSYTPIILNHDILTQLQENLLLLYYGNTRSANQVLSEQNNNMQDPQKVKNLREMCLLTDEMKFALENNNLQSFGEILHQSWQLKRTLASGISNERINEFYNLAIENGATGGKLLGAGGGGFLLFYCEKERQDQVCTALGLKQMKFRFEHDGTSVIYIGEKYW